MCVYIYIYMCVCVCACVYIYICMCVYICVCACIYINIYVCVCVYIYIYMCVCVCVYVCVCIYIYIYRCFHPPFVGCYAIQAFSIAFDFDPKLIPKIRNQITMRKICIFIHSLLSRRPNHHSCYSQDHEKQHTLITLKQRQNVFYDVINVEQHEQLVFDASRLLPDVIPERTNTLAVVEGVLSRFFQATAAAITIGHVCQARCEVQAEKGQHVPCQPPGERELGVFQETRTWRPIPVGADHLNRPAVPLTERIRSGTHH